MEKDLSGNVSNACVLPEGKVHILVWLVLLHLTLGRLCRAAMHWLGAVEAGTSKIGVLASKEGLLVCLFV